MNIFMFSYVISYTSFQNSEFLSIHVLIPRLSIFNFVPFISTFIRLRKFDTLKMKYVKYDKKKFH